MMAETTRTRVKICGITRVEDALAAVQHGADALGLVFYRPSPRWVSIEQAVHIARSIPPFVTLTGLFVNHEPAEIQQILDQIPLDLLQFHGDESPAQCSSHRRPWIKALRVRPELDLLAEETRFSTARALLLDAYRPGVPGGTGEVFDWALIPRLQRPFILAGGLEADNVAHAIQQVRPYAVDVSGGVEESRGIKSAGKMAAFMRGVRSADG